MFLPTCTLRKGFFCSSTHYPLPESTLTGIHFENVIHWRSWEAINTHYWTVFGWLTWYGEGSILFSKASGVIQGGAGSSADLGGSSKYSNENFEE